MAHMNVHIYISVSHVGYRLLQNLLHIHLQLTGQVDPTSPANGKMTMHMNMADVPADDA